MHNPPKSTGHISFVCKDGTPVLEFYCQEGEVYRAKAGDPVQTDGYRHGRWEARSAERWQKAFEIAAKEDASLSLC